MPDKSWKALERQVAGILGGRRILRKGEKFSDVEGVPGWVIEAKYRSALAIDSMFRLERAKRRKEIQEGNKFALAIRAKGRNPLIVLSLEDFSELLRANQEEKGK